MEPQQTRPARPKKMAGRKSDVWLNRLLALGCVASLLPLYAEYHWTTKQLPPKPAHDDPWVVHVVGPTTADGARHAATKTATAAAGSLIVDGDGSIDQQPAGPHASSSDMDAEKPAQAAEPSVVTLANESASPAAIAPMPVSARTTDAAASTTPKMPSSAVPSSAPPRKTASPAAATAGAAAVDSGDDATRAYLRAIDAASNATAPHLDDTLHTHYVGGDFVDLDAGGRVWPVSSVSAPSKTHGRFVSDGSELLSRRVRGMLEGNLTLLTRTSKCLAILVVLPELPPTPRGRRVFGGNILRDWLYGSPNLTMTSLILVSPRAAEVVVGDGCTDVLLPGHARHFSVKATELLRSKPDDEHLDGNPFAGYSRLEETCLKLCFYIPFVLRSRAAIAMMSMRLLSLSMMLFMVSSMSAQRRRLNRRYELYRRLQRSAGDNYVLIYDSWDDDEALDRLEGALSPHELAEREQLAEQYRILSWHMLAMQARETQSEE